jgi:hypothetical protein
MGSHRFKNLSYEDTLTPKNHLFQKLPLAGASLGLASLLIAFYLGTQDKDHFFMSFHVWWLFFFSLSAGCIFFVLIQFATKAGWSVAVRRIAENIGTTMPLFLVLLVVMFVGSHTIYHHWLSEESFSDPVLSLKRWYLNTPFLYGRSIFYLVAFSAAGIYFSRLSAKQDISGDQQITRRLQNASIPFLIVLGFSITFAAFDWIMSLDPHWYSTIFGLYFFAGCYVSAIALISIFKHFAQKAPEFRRLVHVEHDHDLGKLLFAHSIFWAYAAFSQYLLIWYGNIPEETMWYEVRQTHEWWWVWSLLCIGHFVVPLLFLMARRAKRNRKMVFALSLWVLFMQFVDIYWLVMPTHYPEGPHFTMIDLFCLLGIGGLFLSIAAAGMRKKPLLPIRDPRLSESLTYENV